MEEDGFKLVKTKRSSRKNRKLTKTVSIGENIQKELTPEEIQEFLRYVEFFFFTKNIYFICRGKSLLELWVTTLLPDCFAYP